MCLVMAYVVLVRVSVSHAAVPAEDSAAALRVAAEIGKMVAKMHDAQVTNSDVYASLELVRVFPFVESCRPAGAGVRSEQALWPTDFAGCVYRKAQ